MTTHLGAWAVSIVSGGTFRLDGGSMFGTVPKVLWDKVCPADADNMILLGTNCLLLQGDVEGRRRVILVDNGNGDKEPDSFMARFKFEGRGVLERSLAREGVTPADIDLVVLTHLHFDHAGGSTRLDAEGRAVPAFPNARYLVQAEDLATARAPHLRERASYFPKNWEPLEAAGLLDTLPGPGELLPGLSVRAIPGHTAGLQAVVVEGGGRKLIYLADLIPTSHHIQPAWVMGYDLDVRECVDQRLRLLEEVADTDTILVFEHDPTIPAGTVSRDARGRYVVTPVEL
jgi:glyoxylase-like metal-dependent hydrolase (beta-lactamase superfamily II)